jgi:SAM-dependent methyltransferase
MRKIIYFFYQRSKVLRKLLNLVFPTNKKLVKLRFQESFLEQYIYSFYESKSLENRAFYNIGAGNQRSKFKFWSYVDLKESKYLKKGVDVFFDLEELTPLPLDNECAEVVFNSFVIEHISVEATKNLCKEAYRVLKTGGIFHSKVHSYDYAYRLLNNNVISPMIPFLNRESLALVDDLLDRNKGKVKAYFNDEKQYVIQSKKNKEDKCVFTAENTFLFHNATAAVNNIKNHEEITKIVKNVDINILSNLSE